MVYHASCIATRYKTERMVLLMYEFIAKYENMDTGVVITKKICVDCTPLDAESRHGLPEEQFAWQCAAVKAWDSTEKHHSMIELSLLSM
jgi:hypothetical protein